MLRLLLTVAYPAGLLPLYLEWSRRQAEAQIDKMQRAVFNTPGAESPVPPIVVVGGVALALGYGVWTNLLGGRQRGVGLLLGVPLGVALFALRRARQP